jgi:lysozyme
VIPVYDIGESQGLLTRAHWRVMKAGGLGGVYIRCGNGNSGVDPLFQVNLTNARSVAVPPGAYHVGFPLLPDAAHPGRGPEDQALAHYRASGGLGSAPGELRPVLDFEWPLPVDWPKWGLTAKSIRTWGLGYLPACEELHGKPPMLYTYPDFDLHVLAGATPEELALFARYDLWIARYGAASPGTIAPWKAPRFWQKSDGGGRLPNGYAVDEDVFLGDAAALAELLGQGTLLDPGGPVATLAGVPVPGLIIPGENDPTS